MKSQKTKNDNSDDDIIKSLELRLQDAKRKREAVKQRRFEIAKKLHNVSKLRDSLLSAINQLNYEKFQLLERYDSVVKELNAVAVKQRKYSQISALNDVFFIWYLGPYATINNFRLGNIPTRPVEWTEINAAFGQCVLVISIIYSRTGIEYKKFGLVPLGSFSKVYKLDDRSKTMYPLYTDGSFSLFPKRNFNTALNGFLTCLDELGEHIRHHDPTLDLPNPIDLENNTISGIPVLLGSSDEMWTKALKCMLADIKWIISWYTKHYNNFIQGVTE